MRTDHGNEAAGAPARRLVVPPRRSGGQERYLDRSLPEEIGTDPLAEVVAWALEHPHEQFDVEILAARAYMSRRDPGVTRSCHAEEAQSLNVSLAAPPVA